MKELLEKLQNAVSRWPNEGFDDTHIFNLTLGDAKEILKALNEKVASTDRDGLAITSEDQ